MLCHQFAKKNTERFTHHLHLVGSRCKFLSYQLTLWKYKHFHESENLRQNSFTNDLHKNSFCSCFMNEAHYIYFSVNIFRDPPPPTTGEICDSHLWTSF